MPRGRLLILIIVVPVMVVLSSSYLKLCCKDYRDDKLKEKEDKRGILKLKSLLGGLLILLCMLLVPFFLDWILTERWYEKLHIYSAMSDADWFAFLGSYMGVAGTVAIGLVTLKQTDMLNRKDELLARYQAEPRIQVTAVSALLWHGEKDINELKREEWERVSFIQYGDVRELGENEKNFAIIALEIVNNGSLPAERMDIRKITWKINGKKHKIHLVENKSANIDLLQKIYLLIDERDEVVEKFFEELYEHFLTMRTHERIYEKSELQIFFTLGNDVHSEIPYRLVCRFDTNLAKVENEYLSSDMIHIYKEKGRKDAE